MSYDIWNCGVCLHIVTTNMFPFRSEAEHLIIQHQMNRDFRLQSQFKRLSTDLKQLIFGMLEPDFIKRLNINEVLNSNWFRTS